jgi:DNA polymerase III delta subunit
VDQPDVDRVLHAGNLSLEQATVISEAVERAPEREKTGEVLKTTAHAAGVLLTNDAAQLIAAHLADDAGRVVALVDVLATARDPGTKLSVDDVAPYLGDEGGVPSYLLTNAIEEGDDASARDPASVAHRDQRPAAQADASPQLMSTLLNYYRRAPPRRSEHPQLGRCRRSARRTHQGVPRARRSRSALGTDGIREAFDALARADLDLKGARGIPPDAVMEVLVVRLARLSARAGVGGGGGKRRGSR